MKINGVRTEPLASVRRRAATQAAGSGGAPGARAADNKAFLGLTEADITPPVRGALQTLITEIDELRGQVARLKARLAEVEGLADRDTLTPLLNRRAFMRELQRVRAFSERYESPASVVFFDMDGLKAINDRYGHLVGDAAVKTVAERLAANVRESDLVARMGGDEFAVLLIQADQIQAHAKAEALATSVEAAPLIMDGCSIPLRISYGVCDIGDEMNVEAIIAKADTSMYAHKRARRSA